MIGKADNRTDIGDMCGIEIGSRNWAHRHKRRFSGVLTIEDPDARRRLRFAGSPPEQLVLRFVDMDDDWPEPVPPGDAELHRLATEDDVQRGLDFAARHSTLLVHCEAGVGRSTAMALAIIAQRLGAGREGEALAEVLRLRPEASPNLRVTMRADSLLGRGGALLAVVAQHTVDTPGVQKRRILSRAAHLRDRGYAPSFYAEDKQRALFGSWPKKA